MQRPSRFALEWSNTRIQARTQKVPTCANQPNQPNHPSTSRPPARIVEVAARRARRDGAWMCRPGPVRIALPHAGDLQDGRVVPTCDARRPKRYRRPSASVHRKTSAGAGDAPQNPHKALKIGFVLAKYVFFACKTICFMVL